MNNIVSIGRRDRQLTQEELADFSKDESTAGLIAWRCGESFNFPQNEIRQCVESEQPVTVVHKLVADAFDKHVGHESHLIQTYWQELRKRQPALEKAKDREAKDVEDLKKEGRHIVRDGERDARTPEQKRNAVLLMISAGILWLIGLLAYCYWLHDEAGQTWGSAITSGLVYALPMAIATHVLLHMLAGKKAFYFVLGLVVLVGLLLLTLSAGLFNWDMFSKTMFRTDAGWNDASGGEASSGTHWEQLMVTLRLLGEAIIAGALSAISSHTKERARRFDRVQPSEEAKHEQGEADAAVKNVEYNNGRISHCNRLLKMISDAKASHISKGEAMWNELFEKKINAGG